MRSGGMRGERVRGEEEDEKRGEMGEGDRDPEGVRGGLRDAGGETETSGGCDDGRDARGSRFRRWEQA